MKDKKISFDVDDLNILPETLDDNLSIVEVYVCHDGNNAHNLPIPLDVLKEAQPTLINKPLVASYNGYDFKGHEDDEVMIGFFPESSKMRYEKKNGKTYLVAQAIMPKLYASWAYDIFLKNNNKGVSMEIDVVDYDSDTDEFHEPFLTKIKKFIFNAVTVLGSGHIPACEGSSAQIIKFSKENASNIYNRHNSSKYIKNKYLSDMSLKKFSRKEETSVEKIPTQSDETTYMEGGTIKINNNKEAAIKGGSWSNPEKKLYGPILEASNKKSLIDEAYLIAENGYEDAPSEKLKYPHHKIRGSEIVLDESGVIAAFQRASQEGIVSGKIKEHLLRHYHELGLSTENFEEMMEGGLSMEDKAKREEIEKDNEKEALKKQKQDEKSDRDDEKEIAKKKENDDRAETDDYKEKEHGEEMCKMEDLQKENCELKEKVKKYEDAAKCAELESFLGDERFSNVFTAEEMEAIKEEAKAYSLENLNAFENSVKARAFEHVKSETTKKNFTKMAITNKVDKELNGLW